MKDIPPRSHSDQIRHSFVSLPIIFEWCFFFHAAVMKQTVEEIRPDVIAVQTSLGSHLICFQKFTRIDKIRITNTTGEHSGGAYLCHGRLPHVTIFTDHSQILTCLLIQIPPRMKSLVLVPVPTKPFRKIPMQQMQIKYLLGAVCQETVLA